MRIPYARPSIGPDEIALVTDAVSNGWGPNKDHYIELFETEFAAYVGAKHSIATSSCTGALHLGLAALGVGRGDEVILADTNWVATLAPIAHLGATPVFVDIDPTIWCINPREVKDAITSRTKAVIVTHLYGNVADLDELGEICRGAGVRLIEDAAEGIGSRYGDRHVGSLGHFGVFSFHGSKTITAGEGGMLVTSDFDLFERALTLSNHGRNRHETRMFWPERIGYKFKMSNLQAALGLAQTRRLSELVLAKQESLRAIRRSLAVESEILVSPDKTGRVNGGWMPTVRLPPSAPRAREVIDVLRTRGIDARPVFAPLSAIGVVECDGYRPRAQEFFLRALNLPSPFGLSDLEIEEMTTTLLVALRTSAG